MKKSTLVILIGGFVVFSAFLGPLNQKKVYEKKENFTSTQQILDVLNEKPILAANERFAMKEKDDFLECLSQRKRITDSQFQFAKISIEEVIEMDEKTKDSMLNYYEKLRNNFTKARPVTKEEPVRLKVKKYSYEFTDPYNYEIKEDINEDKSATIIDAVFIDEGEGYVIDFFNFFDEGYAPDYARLSADIDSNMFHDGSIQKPDTDKFYEDIDEAEIKDELTTDEEVDGDA